jgi:Asp-tRNA(Asn)/Glu-tRNA(Gln) amidotransferase C subunit
MSEPDLYYKVQVLSRQLIFLINHRKSTAISTEDKKEAKTTIQEILTELNQYLELDTETIPDRNPGLETMLSYDL